MALTRADIENIAQLARLQLNETEPVFARSLLLGGLHVGIGVVWLSLLSFSLVRIRPLVESRLWRARLEGASGTVLIALAVRLAAERR